MKKVEEALKQHNHNIWQGKDGYWRTYIDDPETARGIKLIKESEIIRRTL